jgi:hypothetical protein
MTGTDLDALARALGHNDRTRRSLIAGLATVASGLTLPWSRIDAKKKKKTEEDDGETKNNKKKKRKKKKKKGPPQEVTPPPAQSVCESQNVCGTGCCAADQCFAKEINQTTNAVISHDCCPASSLCRSVLPNWPDQCCYSAADRVLAPNGSLIIETCEPTLPNTPERRDGAADGICCRTCGDVCCGMEYYCADPNGSYCLQIGSVRLVRHRR